MAQQQYEESPRPSTTGRMVTATQQTKPALRRDLLGAVIAGLAVAFVLILLFGFLL